MDRTQRPRRPRNLTAPALLAALLALVVLSALLDFPRNEPAARRMLTTRAEELDAWLKQELFVPLDRLAFAETGGVADASESWRVVVRALEGAAVGRSNAVLPALDGEVGLGGDVRSAVGARRFTPFRDMEELVAAEWLRAARLFESLIRRTPSTAAAPIDRWLDAAVVLASDLRSTGLLAQALGAAELESAVERRLADTDEFVDVLALQALELHALAAAQAIPPPERFAERESRLAQAFGCAYARVAPFESVGLRDDEPPWPLIATAAAVDRLERYDKELRELLADGASDQARANYAAWYDAVARELPLAARLLADPRLLAPLRDTPARLERIRGAAQRRIELGRPAPLPPH